MGRIFTLVVDNFGTEEMARDEVNEVVTLLELVALLVSDGNQEGVLEDTDGNEVGRWGFAEVK